MREKEEQSAVKAKNVDPSLCPQRSPSARVGSDSFQPHMPQNCAFFSGTLPINFQPPACGPQDIFSRLSVIISSSTWRK
ncbi:uncharacterized protein LOC120892322 isoform X6 [Ictidomys tridecemlineatus]